MSNQDPGSGGQEGQAPTGGPVGPGPLPPWQDQQFQQSAWAGPAPQAPPPAPPWAGPQWQGPAPQRKGTWWLLGIAAVLLTIALIVTAVLVARSGGSKPSAARSPGAPEPSAASTSPAPPTLGQPPAASGSSTLTGMQLSALLPDSAELPGGWTIAPNTEVDTGGTVNPPFGSPTLPSSQCSKLVAMDAGLLMIDYSASSASELLNADPNGLGSPTVELDGFLPGDAAKQLSEIKQHAARCHQFTAKDLFSNRDAYTVTTTPASVKGASTAMAYNVTSTSFPAEYALFAQFGNTIVSVSENGYNQSDISSFPALAATIGQKLKGH